MKETIMKAIVLFFSIAITSVVAFSQNYVPVDEGSKIEFKIKNFGFNSSGVFSGLKGKIHFEPSALSSSAFDVTVESNSVNTDNSMRDNHLKEDGYFDVKNYPVIRFVSQKVSASNKEGMLESFQRKLTIKKTTKDISLPFTAKQENGAYVFDGEFRINRLDFEVGGSSTLSDNVTVSLHVVTRKE